MVVNFRAREISRGARKLTRTPTLIIKNLLEGNLKILNSMFFFLFSNKFHISSISLISKCGVKHISQNFFLLNLNSS
jgi:hypothetical protein